MVVVTLSHWLILQLSLLSPFLPPSPVSRNVFYPPQLNYQKRNFPQSLALWGLSSKQSGHKELREAIKKEINHKKRRLCPLPRNIQKKKKQRKIHKTKQIKSQKQTNIAYKHLSQIMNLLSPSTPAPSSHRDLTRTVITSVYCIRSSSPSLPICVVYPAHRVWMSLSGVFFGFQIAVVVSCVVCRLFLDLCVSLLLLC